MVCFILTSRKNWVKLYFLKVESMMGGGNFLEDILFFPHCSGQMLNILISFFSAELRILCFVCTFPVMQWSETLVLLRTVSPFFFLKLARKESSLSSHEMDANPTVTHPVELISYQLNGDDFFCSLKNKFL